MPVNFLSPAQRDNYGRYPDDLSQDIIANHFFLDDQDREWIATKRGDFSRLGYALQLVTVRFLGTFIINITDVPSSVIERIASQINIINYESCLSAYQGSDF